MAEEIILLDTDILISLAKGHAQITKWISSCEDVRFIISSISLFELYVGAFNRLGKKQLSFIDSLPSVFEIIELESSDMRVAAKIAASLQLEGNSLDYRDIFIATAALKSDACVKTGNVSHFSRIDGVKLA